jgi:hypothetical protein
MVIAIPVALVVQGDQEHIVPLQRFRHLLTGGNALLR